MNVIATPPRSVIPPALADWAVTHVDLSEVPPGEFVVVTIEQAATGRTWDKDTAIPPHPAPEVTARDATEAEIWQAPRLIRKAALAAGFEVRVTYARGTVLHLTGKPGAVKVSIAVRIHKPGIRAWAVWLATKSGGSFETGQIWEPDVCAWPRNVGATELAERIAAEPVEVTP